MDMDILYTKEHGLCNRVSEHVDLYIKLKHLFPATLRVALGKIIILLHLNQGKSRIILIFSLSYDISHIAKK